MPLLPQVPAVVVLEPMMLARLVDPVVRQKAAERGLAHVRKFHSQEAVVAALRPIYQELLR